MTQPVLPQHTQRRIHTSSSDHLLRIHISGSLAKFQQRPWGARALKLSISPCPCDCQADQGSSADFQQTERDPIRKLYLQSAAYNNRLTTRLLPCEILFPFNQLCIISIKRVTLLLWAAECIYHFRENKFGTYSFLLVSQNIQVHISWILIN